MGLGQDDGKKLTDEYVRQQLSGMGIGDGGIGSRATLVVDHSAIGEGGLADARAGCQELDAHHEMVIVTLSA